MNMPPFEISITNIPFDLKSSSAVARIPQSFISAVSILFEFQKNIRAKIWRFDGSIQRSDTLGSVRVNFHFLQCKTFVRERDGGHN